MFLPEYVKNCIDELSRAGFSAYAVGGAVRDGLLGLKPSDFDVTTSARPEEILAVFSHRRTIPTGIKHGTITVLFEDGEKLSPIEITTFRIDGEYRDSRHPESVSFSKDVRDDLSRRDFTVNAMAYNESEGIIDAHGGARDLEARVIRAVGDPETRFNEDALRILRAFRFAAQLEFEIEPSTLSATKTCAPLLKNIARERIGVEFKKLLASRGVSYALEKMIENGIWSALFSAPAPLTSGQSAASLTAVASVITNAELPTTTPVTAGQSTEPVTVEQSTTPPFTVANMDKMAKTVARLSELSNGQFATRLAVLLADLDITAREDFLNSLRLSNEEKRLVLRLCRVKEFDLSDNKSAECLARQFLHLYGNVLPLASEVLRFYNPCAMDFLRVIELESAQKCPLEISDLAVNGNDLLPLCRGNYKQVGLLLKSLLNSVIDDPALNTKEKLLLIASSIIQ